MEISLRILNSPHLSLNRHLSRSILNTHSLRLSSNLLNPNNRPPTPSHFSSPNSNSPSNILSLSASQFFSSAFHGDRFSFPISNSEDCSLGRERLPGGEGFENLGVSGEKGPVLTAVLMGWLGAERKHLKKYAELYNSRGIRTVPFTVTVKELLGFDLGRRVERRIEELAQELISWLSETEKDGRERGLVFHTFSNTGWLGYGAVLDNLQQRGDFMNMIKGCVIDSGGDPEINPQVWAAGFTAALLKKHSSSIHTSARTVEGNALDERRSHVHDDKLPLTETLLLSVLEMFFSNILRLPDVNQRLCRIISVLSNSQPLCPQLYLYSDGDKVIPAHSIELFIEKQKKSGRKTWTHNFGSSPHVDHLRSFPHLYSAELQKFLQECMLVMDLAS